MRFVEIPTGSSLRTFAIVFQTGDEVSSLLKQFALEQGLTGARFTAVGGFSEATLGYFVWDRREYEPIPIDEQVEVLSFLGDVALDGNDPVVHAHVTVGHRGGKVTGGHLLRGIVRPTLEVMLDELPEHLQKTIDPAAGIPLIDPSISY
jgi:predicted DNA-binding protein with PD1-like motif